MPIWRKASPPTAPMAMVEACREIGASSKKLRDFEAMIVPFQNRKTTRAGLDHAVSGAGKAKFARATIGP
jgi:hypothetical protein